MNMGLLFACQSLKKNKRYIYIFTTEEYFPSSEFHKIF